ncbi:MAG: HAMP domain-containing histidine kinase [Lachnospiraceae bacterium]|nr:HAMP domain-containing histidine kinase [Lachnospiraceae bacterium]
MKSIFSKTFFSSIILTLAVVGLSFLLIWLLMPRLYIRYKEQLLESDLREILMEGEGKDLTEIKKLVSKVADRKNYVADLYDQSGEMIMNHGLQTVTSYTMEADGTSEEQIGEYQITVRVLSKDGTIRDSGQETYSLVLLSSLEPVDEAKDVILRLLPMVLAISVLLTVLFSYVHARMITGPIGNISSTVKKMKTLDRDALCDTGSEDEIGNLAGNINELYGRLMRSIDELQEEYDRKTAMEKERMDLMLAVSHELKTPLTSVKGMLECMQYNVGVYKDHETYLKECVDKVDEMTGLISETLAASKLGISEVGVKEPVDLGETVAELISEYELIALKRGVSFETGDFGGKKLMTSRELFQKALSNIISNAVKYSDRNGVVRIRLSEAHLVVENPCTPLKKEELEGLFLPFVRKEENEEGGHGLGLYLTDRILKVCGIEYRFEPFEGGMRFSLKLE